MSKRRLTLGIFAILLLSLAWVGSRLWAGNKNIYLSFEVFLEALKITSNNYVREVDIEQMVEDAMNGMLRKLDPYSMYMSPDDYENLNISMQGQFGGLGITIGITDDWLTVISPLEGTPADSVGLLAGDRIIEIEGESTEGITIDEAVSKLRGEPGTQVSIKVARHGIDEPLDFTITRAVIKLNAVTYAARLTPEVGYIRFAKFSRTAHQEVKAAVDSLFSIEGVEKLILDIRGNSGGLLSEGVDVTDLFLPRDREIVQTRGRVARSVRTYRSHEAPLFGDYPLVVLTDYGSASAAEILSGALQDWERALIIGDTTFGKGSVQTLHNLPDSGRLKLTTAYWYTPSGRCIDKHRYTLDGEDAEPARYTTLGSRKRPLYGGGAIAPDIYVEVETKGQLLVRKFFSKRVFFYYAVDYLSKHPDIELDFSVTDEMLEELAQEAERRELEFSDSEFEEAKDLLSYRLKLEIAAQKWGRSGEYQVMLDADPVVQKALELLAGAKTTAQLFSYAD